MIVLSVEDIEKRIADSYELPNNVLQKISEPLVSVRTSTYNHGKYIKYCIEGVLMQKTTFPFEFIIGEDCSTDETREIVFEYAKKYPDIIRVITADYNVGSKANGRRCIRACRGKYMAICEGDDYWTDPLKLQKQVDFLEANPNYVFCCHRFKMYDEDTKKWLPEYAYSFYKDGKDLVIDEKLMLKTWVTQPLTSVIVMEHYKTISTLVSKYKYSRDVHTYYFLLKLGKGISLNQSMGVYRLHRGGIASCRSPIQKYRESVVIYGELLKNNLTDFYLWKVLLHCLLALFYYTLIRKRDK